MWWHRTMLSPAPILKHLNCLLILLLCLCWHFWDPQGFVSRDPVDHIQGSVLSLFRWFCTWFFWLFVWMPPPLNVDERRPSRRSWRPQLRSLDFYRCCASLWTAWWRKSLCQKLWKTFSNHEPPCAIPSMHQPMHQQVVMDKSQPTGSDWPTLYQKLRKLWFCPLKPPHAFCGNIFWKGLQVPKL